MKKLIILAILGFVLYVILQIRTSIHTYHRLVKLAEEPFVCPNCGHRFYVKWYKLIFEEQFVHTRNKAPLRCPKCKIKDMCSRPSLG